MCTELAASPPAGTTPKAQLRAVTQGHASELEGISSDFEALDLYRKTLGKALGLGHTLRLVGDQRPRSRRAKRTEGPSPPDLTPSALAFTRALAVWDIFADLKLKAPEDDFSEFERLSKTTEARRAWLLGDPPHEGLSHALNLVEVLFLLRVEKLPSRALTPDHYRYFDSLDQAFPNLTGTSDSWVAVAEREGIQGVWGRLVAPSEANPTEQAISEEAARLYFFNRLRTVMVAQTVALAIRGEAEAEHQAVQHWSHLQGWWEEWSMAKGLVRLCGTWIWIVHNHRNHQDNKMMITFPPPDSPSESGPMPEKIVVLGDGVYLRWEFQGGYQEDSLLFTAEGQRLEGTFVNSAGIQGTITGKRSKPCKKG